MTKEIIPVADPIREIKKIKNFKKLYFEEFMKGRFVGGENITLLQNKLDVSTVLKPIISARNSLTKELVFFVLLVQSEYGIKILSIFSFSAESKYSFGPGLFASIVGKGSIKIMFLEMLSSKAIFDLKISGFSPL